MKIICGFEKPDSGRMFLRGEPYEPHSVDYARSLGIDTVYQDLALVDQLVGVPEHVPAARAGAPPAALPRQPSDARGDARGARRDRDQHPEPQRARRAPVGRPAPGDRGRPHRHSEADILLLDEPLAAMGAKEGGRILDLIERLKQSGEVSIIMVLHNYVHVLASCDRVNLIQDGVIALDKPTSETSVEELTEIVVDEYRRARLAADRRGGRLGMSYVVGVDFGTLSARAVVVARRRRRRARVRGARVRARGHGPHAGGDRRRAPAAVGAAGPGRLHRGAADGGARGASRRRASTPRDVVGIGTDFTASTPLPVLADGTPLCQVAGFEDRPHAYVKLWKHHAAQRHADRVNAVAEERGEPWLARYGGRISSEWEFAKALQVLEEDPEAYERDGPLDRGRRLDRLAALRARDAQRLHRRLQGHPPGRRLSVRGLPARARRRASPASSRQARGPAVAARRTRRGPHRARPRSGRACRRASRSRSATSTRTSPRPAARRSTPARCSRSWAPRPATS